VFYQDDSREGTSRVGRNVAEKKSAPSGFETPSFAQRLQEPLSRRIDGSQERRETAPAAAGAGTPSGGQGEPQGSQNKGSGGEYNNPTAGDPPNFPEAVIGDAIARFSAYLMAERERYRPQGRSLSADEKALFGRFFSPELLGQIRVVVLSGSRLENPPFHEEAKALGVRNLPDMPHKATATFLDVIVFNDHISGRELFHALVHAAQVHVLGARLFAELFVREVMRARSYSLAPLKAQAFALEAQFAADAERAFSVEDQVRTWLNEARY